ncbi:Disease resistance response protein 206 [Platanthera guangdongensis]|uniref:Dirigent protein n=1 Tax=Platanthera guangdongensis TaxID=2320717 RepID=A0ABR2MDS3_9ASPA
MATAFFRIFVLGGLLALFLPAEVGVANSEGADDHGLIHLRFFWHDTSRGPDPSAVDVAQSPTTNASATRFGQVRVFDDPITVGLNISTEKLGKSQGIYLSADKEISGLLMDMNFYFITGRYNGSTFAVMGRNPIESPVREMPVVGGTQQFRFATGYVQAHTRYTDLTIGYNIVEYNCYLKINNY